MGTAKHLLSAKWRAKKVKLAIATKSHQVSSDFENSETFMIYEIIQGEITSIIELDTSNHLNQKLVPYLNEKGVDVILTGNMSDNTSEQAEQRKLLVFKDIKGEIEQVVTDYINGKISWDKPTHCGGCCCSQGIKPKCH